MVGIFLNKKISFFEWPNYCQLSILSTRYLLHGLINMKDFLKNRRIICKRRTENDAGWIKNLSYFLWDQFASWFEWMQCFLITDWIYSIMELIKIIITFTESLMNGLNFNILNLGVCSSFDPMIWVIHHNFQFGIRLLGSNSID